MRIAGHRAIKTLPGLETRPTASRVREALFNIWQASIPGCRWLDLCSGSGSMGAEALCRGAQRVVGIEQSGPACAIVQQNWSKVARSGQTFQVYRGDVVRVLNKLKGQPFDRIYFDPPYASDLYEPVLVAIAALQLLTLDGEMAVEHGRDRALPLSFGALVSTQTRTYGSTGLTFYRHHGSFADSTRVVDYSSLGLSD